MWKLISIVLFVSVLLLLAACQNSITGEAKASAPKPTCSDGRDNDNDGRCDYSGARTSCPTGITKGDAGCSSSSDTTEHACGNSLLEQTFETCDGNALGGKTCTNFGYTGGTLGCSADCRSVNTAGCTLCGDGILSGTETCESNGDGTVQTPYVSDGTASCTDYGYTGGILKCTSTCGGVDTTSCTNTMCGNNILEANEQCDTTQLGLATCQNQGYSSGLLRCSSTCQYDTSGCMNTVCGNGIVETGETCDGTNVNGQTCQTQGYSTGTLACASDCTSFNTAGCSSNTCGNGVIDADEVCDSANLAGKTCTSIGDQPGDLSCQNNCKALNVLYCGPIVSDPRLSITTSSVGTTPFIEVTTTMAASTGDYQVLWSMATYGPVRNQFGQVALVGEHPSKSDCPTLGPCTITATVLGPWGSDGDERFTSSVTLGRDPLPGETPPAGSSYMWDIRNEEFIVTKNPNFVYDQSLEVPGAYYYSTIHPTGNTVNPAGTTFIASKMTVYGEEDNIGFLKADGTWSTYATQRFNTKRGALQVRVTAGGPQQITLNTDRGLFIVYAPGTGRYWVDADGSTYYYFDSSGNVIPLTNALTSSNLARLAP